MHVERLKTPFPPFGSLGGVYVDTASLEDTPAVEGQSLATYWPLGSCFDDG